MTIQEKFQLAKLIYAIVVGGAFLLFFIKAIPIIKRMIGYELEWRRVKKQKLKELEDGILHQTDGKAGSRGDPRRPATRSR